jgi:O-acetyl-ADP-ribose deacetylase (regulator of RNase III)
MALLQRPVSSTVGRVIVDIRSGDILRTNAEVLVNAVNTEGVMTEGLGWRLRRAFPEMYQEYCQVCRRNMLPAGTVHFWLTGRETPRLIANVPIKRAWGDRPRIGWVGAGLEALASQVEWRAIKSVAIPPLGCEPGGLEWEKVHECTVRAFRPLPFVAVRLYPPRPAPVPVKRRVVKKKATATRSGRRAAARIR